MKSFKVCYRINSGAVVRETIDGDNELSVINQIKAEYPGATAIVIKAC